ncbi:ABC-type transport system involved in cytochrome c biogenesis, permease component [Fibrobacter sp. UWCM]|uniref:cytochrome c biogenesis protein n=1 Tax=Fibrobacter sp. UWCM TaxID=1896208 RepID=UPI00091C8170|nr:cytochrome c biogenesis protein CcsA [Fibrobacter sp. UWCM]SHG48124.1 ABC-type transport system involved in cytochrome c biogenesis, permease component [Fibrobacter sp. UWCM]
MKKLASLKVTVVLLVAFLVLTFWGTLAQANAEAAGYPASIAVDRFFDSYFIWALGIVPLPAFKSIAILACVNLVASMVFRMPRGWKNAGLWLMHVALLVLLAGGVVGSEIKREYNGFEVLFLNSVELPDSSGTAQKLKFYAADDSLGAEPANLDESVLLAGWPYYVHFRGDLPMSKDKVISMYKVYYDPFHFVPYAFMVLFLLGAVFHYVVQVRSARKSVAQTSAACMGAKIVPLLALVMFAMLMNARADEIPSDALVRFSVGRDAPVIVDGVVRPFDSFARGFLDDLSGRVTFKCGNVPYCERLEVRKLSAENVVRLILNNPEEAKNLALFKVLRSDVLEALRLPADSRYVSYAELAPSRNLLELYASRDDSHPATSEMKRLYANVLQYEAVKNGTAFSIVEESSSESVTVDENRLAAEVFYHKANFALIAFILAFIACLLASLNMIFRSRKLDVAANLACIATAGILSVLFALRTYVAARVPLSSLYEIVLLVAMLLMAFESGAFIFCKRRTFSLMIPVTFMAALLLFFAKFVLEPGDTFRPIPAVLNSSVFLTIHVFTIALGFAGMLLSGVVAHMALFRASSERTPLDSLLYGTLVFGAVFTMLGTLLGGVWADFAWGRFWGFDPKECGALFVILWAMLLLHLRVGRLVDTHGFALLNCFNVIVTFLCWFGVNLLGVGLHSYGFQGGTAMWLAIFVAVDVLLIVLIERLVARRS